MDEMDVACDGPAFECRWEARRVMVTGVFDDRLHANMVFDWLRARGYDTCDINVLMSDRTLVHFRNNKPIEAGSKLCHGAALVGVYGMLVGALLGFDGSTLAGVGIGAIVGIVVGAIIGDCFVDSNARAYERALRHGGVALGVVPRSPEETAAIKDYFQQHRGSNVVVCSLR